MEPDKLVVVVDGEAAIIAPYHLMSEKVKAALLSNPVFVPTSENVAEGWKYDFATKKFTEN